jgi:hypothetical protein
MATMSAKSLVIRILQWVHVVAMVINGYHTRPR